MINLNALSIAQRNYDNQMPQEKKLPEFRDYHVVVFIDEFATTKKLREFWHHYVNCDSDESMHIMQQLAIDYMNNSSTRNSSVMKEFWKFAREYAIQRHEDVNSSLKY